MKTIHYIIIWLSLLIIAPVAYYFICALPKHNQEVIELQRREIELKEENARNEQYAKEREENNKIATQIREAAAEEEKQNKYEDCIASANKAYSDKRSDECTKQANEDWDRYTNCLWKTDNDITNPYCKSLINVNKWDKTCTFPSFNNAWLELNAVLEKMKKDCFNMYKE